ncbi:MAG TPA: VOC family protein [Mesorhizobium sp.]|jgi:catechol 2,3-dioxygenase-like lactoylglutathione lyase family enzyme|uniref:VOC family protein n=1 Tax=Mesorhizobium sp. TaxID=1871066 RepID=UPI002DDD1414|nr:VOC family protein [Mesorhizobium sp.]HEV2506161.1 VOC family protein [Mesorhizobium sp.]
MSGFATERRVATVTLVVADYDEAIRWYVDRAGFTRTSDVDLGGGKRWVTIEPACGGGARLLLAKADGAGQVASIGNQTGGRVAFFLETDDFARDHTAMLARGVEFREAPRHEPYGTVAVFADLYGNLWDLLQPKR